MSGTFLLRALMLVTVPIGVLGACAVVVLVDVRTGMYVLAGLLVALGAARLVGPAEIAARSRTFDVVLLLGLALAIALLAPWGNAALPTGQ